MMNLRQKRLLRFWEKDKSLTILLAILAAHIFIAIPLGNKTIAGQIFVLVFYISVLVAGMFLLVKNTVVRGVLIFILVAMIVLGSGLLFESTSFEIVDNLVVVLYFIMLGWVVLLRTFGDGPITIHRVQGAVVVYLLIGLIFALLYHSFFLLYGETAFKGLDAANKKEFMYFSLTTLTTVGYGDISAATPMGRSLSNLEALIGQLYPAILIARLVSMEFESSKDRNNKNK